MNSAEFFHPSSQFWIGIVEDINDPMKLGRVKVRIYGFYGDIAKEDLPWAMTAGPIQSAGFQQSGYSHTGLLVGSTVLGIFLDGEDCQVPLVLHSLIGNSKGKNDHHEFAKEEQKKPKVKKREKYGNYEQPESAAAPRYPYNHVISGVGKVIIEHDNTLGKERFSWEVPSKSWFEAQPNGDTVMHTEKDHYHGINGNAFLLVKGNADIYVGKNATITVEQNVHWDVKGNYSANVKGNYSLTIGGSRSVNAGGSTSETSGGTHNIQASTINLN